jgi:hypothetical protein
MFIPGVVSYPDSRINFYNWQKPEILNNSVRVHFYGMQIFSYNSEEIRSQMSTWDR